ncbi:MAG: transcription termination factor Rho [Lachnospiraceae bacterium]|jgi:transcription termination factor Rho
MPITREQLSSLSLASLRETAASLGIKKISKARKSELIDILLAEQDRRAAQNQNDSEKKQTETEKNDASAREMKAAEGALTETEPSAEKPKAERERKPKAKRTRRETASRSKKEEPQTAPEKEEALKDTAVRDEAKKEPEAKPKAKRAPTKTSRTAARKRQTANAEPHKAGRAESEKSAEERETLKTGDETAQVPEKETGQSSEKSEHPERPAERKDLYGEQDEVRDEHALGILEIMPEGYGFIRSENYLPGENDVYVSATLIHRFHLRTGDVLTGIRKYNKPGDKFMALAFLSTVNGLSPMELTRRPVFEKLTPIFPDERIRLEREEGPLAMRMVDLISPIGKGQRGMIVAQPKAGKTTLLKQIAKAIVANEPSMHVIILLIDERPEEVTDMKETVLGENVEVIYSTFDELPEHHKRVAEMTIERAKRLVEQNEDVIILLDSITRLARAYNLTVTPSGKTLSGGLDPTALYGPKRFFGAARNTREGGSLTILASALVETGSKMDDVVFEEFKGTGNMELVLDRKLSEKRVFPAIDLAKSSTRREDLLLTEDELIAVSKLRRALNGVRPEEAAERIIDLFYKTHSNATLVKLLLQRNYI